MKLSWLGTPLCLAGQRAGGSVRRKLLFAVKAQSVALLGERDPVLLLCPFGLSPATHPGQHGHALPVPAGWHF